MNKKALIKLEKVSKEYRVGGRSSKVINEVDLVLSKGDRIGLIGDNGAGKTTLFKLITGVTRPTGGKIERHGKIVALMNLEDGFDLELTGRENIMLNGLLIGMSVGEIKKKIDKIIDFSGVGEYINSPFFTYSSGMKFRLAFAVAIASECDVLLMDEIFLVGDFKYQSKILAEIRSFKGSKSDVSLMISSHVPAFLLGLINKCYELKEGKLVEVKMSTLREIVKERDRDYMGMLKVDNLLER